MNGTEKQINYANDLLNNLRKCIESGKKVVPAEKHEAFEAMFSEILTCENAGKVIDRLQDLPRICDDGECYTNGRMAWQIKPMTWQGILKNLVNQKN